MAQVERMQTECPPDAHKVIRPPENDVNATLVVKLSPLELQKYGVADLCEVLSLLGSKPLIMCDDAMKSAIEGEKGNHEDLNPAYLIVDEQSQDAFVRYSDGAQGSALPYVDMAAHLELTENFFAELAKKQFIIVDSISAHILRSISTVYPWDKLLAAQYLKQYHDDRAPLTMEDIEAFLDVRFGRIEAFPLKEKMPIAYKYLQLERKLFLQYPTEDDD